MFSAFLVWLTNTKAYAYLMKRVIPYIRFTTYYTSLRGDKYHEGYRMLQPGDFVLTVDKKKLTTFLIPGTFSHAAFCVAKNDSSILPEIIEMTHTDYTKSWFFDLCKEADRVAIFRILNADLKYISKMIFTARQMDGTPYDITFTLGLKALSCSELIYFIDSEKRMQASLKDIHGLNRPYITPDGLAKAAKVVCVYDSDDMLSWLTGVQIEQMKLV